MDAGCKKLEAGALRVKSAIGLLTHLRLDW